MEEEARGENIDWNRVVQSFQFDSLRFVQEVCSLMMSNPPDISPPYNQDLIQLRFNQASLQLLTTLRNHIDPTSISSEKKENAFQQINAIKEILN